MKRRIGSWLCAAFTLAGVYGAAPIPANGVAAIVNDEVITWKNVVQEASLALESKLGLYSNRPEVLDREIKKAEQDALDILVARKLILHEFKEAGFNLPESLIDDRVSQRLRKKWGGDRTRMAKDLQDSGLTMERYRQLVREEIIWDAMRARNIAKEILISPYKIEKYYADNLAKFKLGDQVKLRTIMINKPATGPAEPTRKRAEEILAKLTEGAGFAEMAGVYSEDTFHNKGGDRGWVDLEREHYQKVLEDSIRSLKAGQRSGVVDGGGAYWILLLEETQANHVRTLPEVREEIEQTLLDQERTRLEKLWIERLKAKSFVRYF